MNTPKLSDSLIEEYKQVRGEINKLAESIQQLFLVAIVSNTSLISGLAALFYKLGENGGNRWDLLFSYMFLLPMLITIPILYLMKSHRSNLHRSATYLKVFFEEEGLGFGWETKVDDFRRKYSEESLDFVPWVFWSFFLISTLLLTHSILVYSGSLYESWFLVVSTILLLTIVAFFLYDAHRKFSKVKREDYYRAWQAIKTDFEKTN